MKKIVVFSIIVSLLVGFFVAKEALPKINKPLSLVAAHSILIDNEAVFLGWVQEQNANHRVEIYYSTAGFANYNDKNNLITLPAGSPDYYIHNLSNANEKVNYYTIYLINNRGTYSKPRYCYTIPQKEVAKPDSIISIPYGKYTIYSPTYVLNSTYYFFNGTLIGISSDTSIQQWSYNIKNNPLTGIDIWSRTTGNQDTIPFAIYRDFFDTSMSSLSVKKNADGIEFIRTYLDNSYQEIVKYTTDNATLNVHFASTFSDRNYIVRINLLGDDNVKNVSSWEASQISALIDEPQFDSTPSESINLQYEKDDHLNYQHKESVFNDAYPYTKTRKFLKVNNSTVFDINMNNKALYKIHNIKGTNNFFYKNCSGEEGFTFGHRWPYAKPVATIKNSFDFSFSTIKH